MKPQSQYIAQHTLLYLIQSVTQFLHVRKLSQLRPSFTQQFPLRITHNALDTIYKPIPKFKQKNGLVEDDVPANIKIDQYSNFFVGKVDSVDQRSIVNKSQNDLHRQTESSFQQNSLSNQYSPSQKFSKEIYFKIPKYQKRKAIELPLEQMTEQEIQFEREQRRIQNRMYYMRKMQKQYEKQEKQRIQALKKRKSLSKPKTDFTYSFNGELLERKQRQSQHFDISQMKQFSIRFSVDQHPENKNKQKRKKHLEEQDEQESSFNQSNMNTRYRKTSLFNNYNKRQISHLPFIKMADNAKVTSLTIQIQESHKSSQGGMSRKITLKTFTEDNGHKSFRHYNEIQKEKKDQEIMRKRKQMKANEQDTETNHEEYKMQEENPVQKRQSYMMNRYLKKLKDKYQTQPLRKSLNFSRANFPQTDSIHKFYKHDFNTDRKNYESYVTSRVIDV